MTEPNQQSDTPRTQAVVDAGLARMKALGNCADSVIYDSCAQMVREITLVSMALDRELSALTAQLAEARRDAEVGRKWRENSSLEEWFPFTAQELAEARRDAERYRWLRPRINNHPSWPAVEALDAAIDAAIQESKK